MAEPPLWKERVDEELKLFTEPFSVSGIAVAPAGDDDVSHYIGTIAGPVGTRYFGFHILADIFLPEDYPLSCPDVRFRLPLPTPTGHMKICDTSGRLTYDIFKDWSYCDDLKKVLLSLKSLFYETKNKQGILVDVFTDREKCYLDSLQPFGMNGGGVRGLERSRENSYLDKLLYDSPCSPLASTPSSNLKVPFPSQQGDQVKGVIDSRDQGDQSIEQCSHDDMTVALSKGCTSAEQDSGNIPRWSVTHSVPPHDGSEYLHDRISDSMKKGMAAEEKESERNSCQTVVDEEEALPHRNEPRNEDTRVDQTHSDPETSPHDGLLANNPPMIAGVHPTHSMPAKIQDVNYCEALSLEISKDSRDQGHQTTKQYLHDETTVTLNKERSSAERNSPRRSVVHPMSPHYGSEYLHDRISDSMEEGMADEGKESESSPRRTIVDDDEGALPHGNELLNEVNRVDQTQPDPETPPHDGNQMLANSPPMIAGLLPTDSTPTKIFKALQDTNYSDALSWDIGEDSFWMDNDIVEKKLLQKKNFFFSYTTIRTLNQHLKNIYGFSVHVKKKKTYVKHADFKLKDPAASCGMHTPAKGGRSSGMSNAIKGVEDKVYAVTTDVELVKETVQKIKEEDALYRLADAKFKEETSSRLKALFDHLIKPTAKGNGHADEVPSGLRHTAQGEHRDSVDDPSAAGHGAREGAEQHNKEDGPSSSGHGHGEGY